MLLANRTVAEHWADAFSKEAPPFVLSAADVPDDEKLRGLKEFVGRLGYKLKVTGTPLEIVAGVNQLLADVRGKPEADLIELLPCGVCQKLLPDR